MNKTELQQVRDALSMNRVMAKDSDGNYTREVTPKPITDALALIDADLARVVEPVAYVHFAKKKPDVKVLSWQKQVSVANKALGFISEPLYSTPQAAAQPSQAVDMTRIEALLSEYWDTAYQEGKEQKSLGSAAQRILNYLRAAINAKGTP